MASLMTVRVQRNLLRSLKSTSVPPLQNVGANQESALLRAPHGLVNDGAVVGELFISPKPAPAPVLRYDKREVSSSALQRPPHGLVDDGAGVGELLDVVEIDAGVFLPRKRVHLSQQFGLGLGTLRQPDDRKRERRQRRPKACPKVTDACQRAEVRGASLLLVCGSTLTTPWTAGTDIHLLRLMTTIGSSMMHVQCTLHTALTRQHEGAALGHDLHLAEGVPCLLVVRAQQVVQQAVGPRLRRTAFLARVSLCLRQNEVECRN